MNDRPTTLGILDRALAPDCPLVLRASRFDQFQRGAGELAQGGSAEPWYGGHAACHALMNGVDTVVLGRLGSPGSAEVVAALERLLEGPLDLVVAPGLTDLTALAALAERLADLGDDAPALLFDTARDASPGAVVFALDHLRQHAPRARLLTARPWLETQSPGRLRAEWLPPSCVAPALVLGTTDALTGLHEVPRVQATGPERDALRQAGALELVHTGARRQVALRTRPALQARPAPAPTHTHLDPTSADPRHVAIEARIRHDLDAALESLAADRLDGRKSRTQQDVWSRARRQATVVLRGYQQRGEILGFAVRCDAETNEGAHPLRPVVEVSIQPRARSVSELVVRVGRG